ncbi:ABC transporter substrate-binding protein [Streptomyces sp. NPDC055105]|uniref:ABC transporter substrate-binding protein n=1 Tax=Streptomyces sp. NPDC055105 TaxID=3365719 RepID=UPI0037D6C834
MAALLMLAAGCGTAQEAPSGAKGGLEQVTIAAPPAAGSLSVIVGIKKGIFKRNGLNVKWVSSGNLSVLAPSLGRQFDLVTSSPVELILARSRGLDLVAVQGSRREVADDPLVSVVAAPDSGITSMKNLEGRTVGSPDVASTLALALKGALKNAGAKPDDVDLKQVNFPDGPNQLKAGQVDAVVTTEPFATLMESAGGVKVGSVIMDAFPHQSSVALVTWAATKGWADDHPETLKKLAKANSEINDWIKGHEGEVRQLMVSELHLPESVAAGVPIPVVDPSLGVKDFEPWLELVGALDALHGRSVPSAKELLGVPQ